MPVISDHCSPRMILAMAGPFTLQLLPSWCTAANGRGRPISRRRVNPLAFWGFYRLAKVLYPEMMGGHVHAFPEC